MKALRCGFSHEILILSTKILMRLIMLVGLKTGFRKKFLFHLERLEGVPKGASMCHLNLLYPTIRRKCMRKSLIKQLDVTVLVEIAICPF